MRLMCLGNQGVCRTGTISQKYWPWFIGMPISAEPSKSDWGCWFLAAKWVCGSQTHGFKILGPLGFSHSIKLTNHVYCLSFSYIKNYIWKPSSDMGSWRRLAPRQSSNHFYSLYVGEPRGDFHVCGVLLDRWIVRLWYRHHFAGALTLIHWHANFSGAVAEWLKMLIFCSEVSLL